MTNYEKQGNTMKKMKNKEKLGHQGIKTKN